MSGHSGDCPCPRCGKTANTYDDWKPHTITQGTCPYCGYFWNTTIGVLSDEERTEARDEQEEVIGEKLTWPTDEELDKEKIKEFDERFSPKRSGLVTKIKISQGIVLGIEGLAPGMQYEIIECDKYGEPIQEGTGS